MSTMIATFPAPAMKREWVLRLESGLGTHKILRWAASEAEARSLVEESQTWRYATGWRILEAYPAWPDLPPSKPNHMTWEECLLRYPRLCALLADCLIETMSGAACCLRDYRDGMRFGSEAVSHSGLSPHDRVKQAVERRLMYKRVWPEGYRALLQRR